jgi:hypothetical protein
MVTFGIGDEVSTDQFSGTVTKIESGDPLLDTDADSFGEMWASADNITSINEMAVNQEPLSDGQTVSSSGFNITRRADNQESNQYVVTLNGQTIGRYASLDYAEGVTESHDPQEDFSAILQGAETPVQGATDAWREAVSTTGSGGSGGSDGGLGAVTGLIVAAGVGAAVLLFGGN